MGLKKKLTRAALLKQYDKPLALKKIEIPRLKPGECLIRMTASGVCGSDVHMWQGQDKRNTLPMILGHEGVGKVVEVEGEKRTITGTLLSPGDKVIWDRGVTCGRCYYCVILKEPSLCPHRWTYGIHKSAGEFPFLNGCFAEHIILRENSNIIGLKEFEDVDPGILVATACSGATTGHAFALARPQIGDTVVIQGPGPLGAFGVDFALAAGANNIVVVGGTEQRMAICKEFGATHLLNRRQTTTDERIKFIQDLTSGRGADFVYETAGSIYAVKEGLKMLRPGGAYVTAGFGVPTPELKIDWFNDIGYPNIKIQGVWTSDISHLFASLSLVTRQPKKYARLVTNRFLLTEVNDALQAVQKREAMKAVIVFP